MVSNEEDAARHIALLKEMIFQKEDELRDRLIYLALDLAPGGRGAYKYLEKRTGIPASRWKNVMLKRQMPTLAMLISLIRYRRPYAEWLLTGDDLGKERSPSSEKWRSFLEYRAWVQETKDDTKEGGLKYGLERRARLEKDKSEPK